MDQSSCPKNSAKRYLKGTPQKISKRLSWISKTHQKKKKKKKKHVYLHTVGEVDLFFHR